MVWREGDNTRCLQDNRLQVFTRCARAAWSWFGWGARPDGPLVLTSNARSGVTLQREHVSLGHTSVTDEDILDFNREFVSEHSTYRS